MVLILLLVICVTISAQMSRINGDMQDIVNNRMVKQRLANQFSEGVYLTTALIYRALIRMLGKRRLSTGFGWARMGSQSRQSGSKTRRCQQ
jgi:hypothetical protein